MNEISENRPENANRPPAGTWHLCAVDSRPGKARSWHYFTGARPSCGAPTFKLTGEDAMSSPVLSWFYIEKGRVCGRCSKTAKKAEDTNAI